MAMLLSVLGKLASGVGGALMASLLTEKVVMQLIVVVLEKLIRSPKTGPDLDKALGIIKKELEGRDG